MSAGAAKTAAEDALAALNTKKTQYTTAKAAAETAFNNAKTAWDSAEETRKTQEKQEADTAADAAWTESK